MRTGQFSWQTKNVQILVLLAFEGQIVLLTRNRRCRERHRVRSVFDATWRIVTFHRTTFQSLLNVGQCSFVQRIRQHWPLFCLLSSIQQRKIFRVQRDLNSDRQNRRRVRWLLDHHQVMPDFPLKKITWFEQTESIPMSMDGTHRGRDVIACVRKIFCFFPFSDDNELIVFWKLWSSSFAYLLIVAFILTCQCDQI